MAATNDKNSLDLSEQISCPVVLHIKYSLINCSDIAGAYGTSPEGG